MDFSAQLWHGADYNPEQWSHVEGIWDEDMRLMRLAHLSSATIGIFSWAAFEPREGEFHFSWMDEIIGKLTGNGQKIVLATPSGGKPHWMAQKYPEIRRVKPNGEREAQQARHNHCPTSPVYRRKTAQINGELARRYGQHPDLLAWHISNEFSGACYCELCFGAFREWLRARYNDNLEELNRRYWSRFWSHTYTDWSQIDFIDKGVHALGLDWQRWTTQQTTDFMIEEIAALRAHSEAPATTNMMGDFTGLDYAAMAPHLDFVSWDAYPRWGEKELEGDESEAACWTAFHHDLFRALKGQPFWLMECSPGQTNWREISKLKAPGLHRLSSWQTVAHGGDGVMYFQWRQSQGSSEKFHAAVVSHQGTENTRTFREVAQLGAELEQLSEVAGSQTDAPVALIYDFESLWALWGEQGPRNVGKDPQQTALDFYRPFWKRGIAVDVIASTADFASYQVVVAPMLYLLRPGVAARLTEFVRGGGTLVTTYWSGLVDENDLCFRGGFPGPLREVLGLWIEETDTLHPHQRNLVEVEAPELGLSGTFEARNYCDLIHLEGARALGHYERDFYAGRAALTVNEFGAGRAYHVASRNASEFQDALMAGLAAKLELETALRGELPDGVVAHKRVGENTDWIWVMNFTGQSQKWTLHENDCAEFTSDEWRDVGAGEHEIAPYGVTILRRKNNG